MSGANAWPGTASPLRVELEQLLGHVAHRLLDARLGLLPGRAAQPIERRPRAAGVLLNEIEPLDRDEQLVVAVVAQLEELLDVRRRSGDRRRTSRAASGRRIRRCRDRRGRSRSPTLRSRRSERNVFARLRRFSVGAALLLENVRLGVDLQRAVGEAEAARQRADGDEHGGGMRVFGALDGHGDDLVLLEDLDRALGAAGAVGNEQHRVAAFARLADVGDPVVDPAAELERRLTGDMPDAVRASLLCLRRRALRAAGADAERALEVSQADEACAGGGAATCPRAAASA